MAGKLTSLRQAILSRMIACLVIGILGSAAAFGMARLETHVESEVALNKSPSIILVDLPPALKQLASSELHNRLAEVIRQRSSWVVRDTCKALAASLEGSGWVSSVQSVRRNSEGLFEVKCRYRTPAAMVQHGVEYFLVDASGVRVPGTYDYDPAFKLIQGVMAPAPRPGDMWIGSEIRPALKLIESLSTQAFAQQISAIIVDNINGRVDAKSSHIELATDRAGGRIRWGSAPGKELEENSVVRKMAILAENYRATGRVDANYLIIDISTFPDRFTVSS